MALQHDVTVSMHQRWAPAHSPVHQLHSSQVQQPKARMYISIDSGYYNQSMRGLSGLHQSQSTDGTACEDSLSMHVVKFVYCVVSLDPRGLGLPGYCV